MMPSRAPKVCSCGQVHPVGDVCPVAAARTKERKARADGRRPSARERGYDAEWERLRANFLRVYPSCKRCGRKADLVDHVIPIAKAPERRLDITNLQSLCTPCHSSWKQANDRKDHHV